MLVSPSNRDLLIGVGAVVAALVVLALVAKYGKQAGKTLGESAGSFVGEAAIGTVYGLGDAVGLPDTRDPIVVSQGRAALERGDYLEASRKMPAMEFLNGIGSKIGTSLYNATHADEGSIITGRAAAGSTSGRWFN